MNFAVDTVAKELLSEGFQVYIVGGAVRDKYMNRRASDVDLASNATPQEMLDLFSSKNYTIVNIGAEFGTVAVIIDKEQVEITTYRRDVKTDGRKVEVEFATTIEEDLARRDFTINTLAINYSTGDLLDLFNGIDDIKNRIVRAVGDPYKRFFEDHLRMLRACRFTALDLYVTIEPSTFDAIQDYSLYIHTTSGGKVTAERQRQELLKGMSYPFPSNMIESMRKTGLLKHVLPEVYNTVGVTQNKHHNIYRHKTTGQFYVKANDGSFTLLG